MHMISSKALVAASKLLNYHNATIKALGHGSTPLHKTHKFQMTFTITINGHHFLQQL